MNIALSAVVVFILLMPPIVFYLSFSYGRYPKAKPKFAFLDGILASGIISLFVHALALLLLKKEVRLDILLKIFGGELKDLENKITNRDLTRCLKHFALYNFILAATFTMLGRLARHIVIRFNHNHVQSELLRLNNRWWHFFNGHDNGKPFLDLVFVDAAVATQEGTIIYTGWLRDFVCDGERLDRIYLEYVRKRRLKLSNDEKKETETRRSSAVPVSGAKFSLPYANIINLNVRFVRLEIEETTDPDD
jgi:hypothetical protein